MASMTNSRILERDPRLAELVRLLAANQQPARLHLFGSRARGLETADSDHDALMVRDKHEAPACQIERAAQALAWDPGISAEILVWSREEFGWRRALKASLPAIVVRDGTPLNAA